MEKVSELIEEAKKARENAYVPYSKFKVGAALLGRSGKIYTGCNIENASYGITVCAERTAILKAVSEGEREFTDLAVVADTDKLTPPCGACRQMMVEFAPKLVVHLGNLTGQYQKHELAELYPIAFKPDWMEDPDEYHS